MSLFIREYLEGKSADETPWRGPTLVQYVSICISKRDEFSCPQMDELPLNKRSAVVTIVRALTLRRATSYTSTVGIDLGIGSFPRLEIWTSDRPIFLQLPTW